MTKFFCFVALAVLSMTASVNAQTLFDEVADGQASGDAAAPTSLGSLTAGTFGLSGSVINTDAATTRDIFSFTVASGFQLDSINITSLTQTVSPMFGPDAGFIFLDEGTTTVIPGGATGGSLLSGNHFGEGQNNSTLLGDNFLDSVNIANPVLGSPGTLDAGDYVLGIQQTSGGALSYSVDLNVSAVPEPSSAALLIAGFGLAGLRRRRS